MSGDFERVKDAINLVSYIQQDGVDLRRAGKLYKACCPFHPEHTPSFVVYEDGGWRCFGACAEGGDVFNYYEKRHNVDRRTALEELARYANIELTPLQAQDKQKMERQAEAHALLRLAADYYHMALISAPGAQAHREYLQRRGFDQSVWERWTVGAAGSNNGLVEYFKRKNVDMALAQEISLIRVNESTQEYEDYFRNRIIIPFLEAGRVTYFTGRAIDDSNPKYLHLPNTSLARKTPYNWRAGGKEKFLVEGALDAWAVDSLAPSGVGVVAVMGLDDGNPLIAKTLERAEQVYIGLDADGTAKQRNFEKFCALVGPERAHIVTWPSGDDAAKWLAEGATADDFAALKADSPTWPDFLLKKVQNASEKTKAAEVEHAIEVAALLPLAAGDAYIARLKPVARPVTAATVNSRYKFARKGRETKEKATNDEAPKSAIEAPFYRDVDGELCAGHGESMQKVITGGTARYTEIVTVDDGDQQRRELSLIVKLTTGQEFTARVKAEESGEESRVVAAIKGGAGPLVSIGARMKRQLPSAIEALSRDDGMRQITEIARTGWLETKSGLAYVTPGGVVGELPEGHQVALPPKFDRFRVADDGDAAFQQGLEGIFHSGLIDAFDHQITLPSLAFAFLPVLERWLPRQRFAMHFSGETGSLKTKTAQILMSFYGDFADAQPLESWRSTENAIEGTFFNIPNAIGLLDDYKPSITKPWGFVEIIHRYADGNSRNRMNRSAQLRETKPMRGWILSTGEDIPVGEASVLARMIPLRFPRRPEGALYNNNLSKAERMAKYFPTVMARYVAWLTKEAANQGLDALVVAMHQKFGAWIQGKVADAPNATRVARNFAILWCSFSAFMDFIMDQTDVDYKIVRQLMDDFRDATHILSYATAYKAVQEKPVQQFLRELQEGIDSGRYRLIGLPTESPDADNVVGYIDHAGVYLLPGAYTDVSERMRRAGTQVGFSRQELYRLLREEGWMLAGSEQQPTVPKHVGTSNGNQATKRVLHLKPEALKAVWSPLVRKNTADDLPEGF